MSSRIRRPSRPGTPTRGRYLVRNPLWNAWLRAQDSLLEIRGRGRAGSASPTPRHVLLCVGGQLGDAVIATSIIPAMRAAIPGVEIGVLCGSWSGRIFAAHPAVARVHIADHWKTSRSERWLPWRWLHWRRTRARALAEIRAAAYDAAIDLSPYYPNAARVLRDARIPIRVGFTSGGEGSLYTHPLAWTSGRHVTGDHLALLDALLARTGAAPTPLPYDVPAPTPAQVANANRRLAEAGVTPGDYVVVHVGAGLPQKEWPVARWMQVVRALASRGMRVVLTGAGSRQAAFTRAVSSAASGVVDLCDRLGWEEFHAVVRQAAVVVTVDTVTMHLASAADVPCVAIVTAIDDPQRWRPPGEHVTQLTATVPCAPCYLSRGCAEMSCIRDVTADAVLAAVLEYLPASLIARG